MGESVPGKQLVVLHKPQLHSRPSRISQRLLLQDALLAAQIRELQRERKEIRDQIRLALARGAKCEPGLRKAAIKTRHVLEVR